MATPPTFAVGQVLTSAVMNTVGTWLITAETVTAQTSKSFEGVFTDDYKNYLIMVDSLQTSGTNSFFYRYLDGSTQRGTAYGWAFTGYGSTGSTSNSFEDVETSGFTGYDQGGANNTVAGSLIMHIFAPKAAARTFAYSQATMISGSVFVARQGITFHDSAVANDGIRFATNSANTFSGNFSIYGYN